MSNKFLILTEAGKNIGLGHYTRCLALHDSLEANGDKVFMIVFLNDFDIDNQILIKENWLNNLTVVSDYKDCETVIIDSYLAQEELYALLQKQFKQVVVIDDYNRIPYKATLLINPNVFFDHINYSNQTAKCIGGKNFVILRNIFRQPTTHKPIMEHVEHLLVTIGGSDFRKILPTIIKACLATQIKRITVVSPEPIDLFEQDNRVSVLPLQDVNEMHNLIKDTDIVIAACGQTLHELASQGKPTIGICLDIDQEPNQTYYLNNGFLSMPIAWNDINIDEKLHIAFKLYEPKEFRQKIAIEAPLLINPKGVNNIITAIKKLK